MPKPRFVVQEHYARTHHFDFRLEKDGVFKSWAVPKGLPEQPGVQRLAIEVEDHDLAFGDFEGEIPAGEYGAGRVATWDSGTYDVESWTAGQIVVRLNGGRLKGIYRMILFEGRKAQWLIRCEHQVQ